MWFGAMVQLSGLNSDVLKQPQRGAEAGDCSSRKVEEAYTNLITRPPNYRRRMAQAISIDSQIKPIRNADRTGNN
jgi:hypothetical protein